MMLMAKRESQPAGEYRPWWNPRDPTITDGNKWLKRKWSALADDFRTLLVEGSLEIGGLDTFAQVSA
jgi:hypothetical protein